MPRLPSSHRGPALVSASFAILAALVVVACATQGPPIAEGAPDPSPSAAPVTAASGTAIVPAEEPTAGGSGGGAGGGAGSGGGAAAAIACDETVTRLPVEETPRTYGFGGYLHQGHRVALAGGEICLDVVYPDGDSSLAKVPCHTSEHLDGGWLRLIANTLARLPRSHALLVRRVVIDNRPKEHGIAPYNRRDLANDARDGHTLWLHERLFEEPNHWAGGNHGRYWSYHVNVDGKLANDAGDSHTLFSPVLIHEIAHLVSYRTTSEDSDREEVPACAAVCGGKSCKKVPKAEREGPCISPYCMPFKNDIGTENFAEQYRFFFQSSATRKLLEAKEGSCFTLIDGLVPREEGKTPWKAGLPDIETFHKSTWASCGEAACKAY